MRTLSIFAKCSSGGPDVVEVVLARVDCFVNRLDTLANFLAFVRLVKKLGLLGRCVINYVSDFAVYYRHWAGGFAIIAI